ncbi:MAG: DUF951 domain-containing protein [Clostridia bacterium]|nr:DUF951 domain-containing protein [Clostridia bacterium]
MEYELKDKLISKKQHPCGFNEWEIIRTGADYKLKCLGCGHIILVDYSILKKMTKQIIKKEN